eukprot:CAMPEP_0204865960 /NCGR_PEP_ID=MMETSP1348-20121228/15273_1 /ASSEMBLY_ACC=CAM_ASM_000700 /TAXON_ID=215587 /ORGANISM="Aplanochytrium stocchinoi, Strain GSBS06" /LENGTH=369 /DNA_ID=CAMNT_0052017621 /DNA_START=248 /DNA_END=1357 /DNA_ORIENTATION=-
MTEAMRNELTGKRSKKSRKRLRWRTKYDSLTPQQVKHFAEYDQKKLPLKYKYKELENILVTLTSIYENGEIRIKKDGYTSFDLEKAIEKVDHALRMHKNFKAREKLKWEHWDKKQQARNKVALEKMQTIVPKKLKSMTEEQLSKKFNLDLARRFHRQPCFRMYHMPLEETSKLHPSDLKHRYYFNGLDITEMRALYEATTGLKKDWRKKLRDKLFEMTTKEKDGTLEDRDRENPAYKSTRTIDDVKNKSAASKRPSYMRPAVTKNEVEMEQVWKARERRASTNTVVVERKNSLTYTDEEEREIAELAVKALEMIDNTDINEDNPEFQETLRRLSAFSSTLSDTSDYDLDDIDSNSIGSESDYDCEDYPI